MTPLRSLFAIGLTALALTGCGRMSPTGPVPDASPSLRPIQSAPNLGTTPSQDYIPTGIGALPQPVDTLPAKGGVQLQLGEVKKDKNGFLWRKLKVSGVVSNPAGATVGGEVVVRFKKGTEVVQTEYVAVAILARGQHQNFMVQSAVAASDAEVTFTPAD